MRKELSKMIGKERLFFDGGTGTVLQSYGIKPGELPENWNLTHADKIVNLHYEYFKAGANIVKTNSFGAYTLKFPLNLERIITSAIENANIARNKIEENSTNRKHFIAYDMTSSGKLLKPMGDLDFEEAVKIFKKTALIALKNEIDCFLIETMNDCYETKACVIAVKEAMEDSNIKIPIFVTNVYDKECRLLNGSTPEIMISMLESLRVDAIGINCSLGPLDMEETIKRLCTASSLPIIINPNAGLPHVENGNTVFDVSADDFVKAMEKLDEYGPAILGGCCGTTPQYIEKLVSKLAKKDLVTREVKETSSICSSLKMVYFGDNSPAVLIGERINPTGKKKFKEALRNNDIPYIVHQGLEQESAGAQVLDVNVGLPEIDEEEMMVKVMTELQSVTNLPLQIDTSSEIVMEKALRKYNGKALVNSVNGKQEIMDKIFPLIKKYGGLVVALTIDEDGIPNTCDGRIKIARKIYAEAEKYGISKKDIIIDSLAMAVSSDSNAAIATLQAVKTIHDEFKGNTSLGISNISFGLPQREFVTAAFFTLAMERGLSAAIMNPLQSEMMKAYRCFCLLHGKDEQCLNYIEFANNYESQSIIKTDVKSNSGNVTNEAGNFNIETLEYAIIHGLKDDAYKATEKLLETIEPLNIINNHLISGLNFVGEKFEQKKMYLPQLLMAADAAKSAFSAINSFMEKSGKKEKPKGTIIIATVKGDIHDIGKNIVKVLLENYGFNVIDLGKDVPPEVIVERCVKENCKLVGLSALMTTTVTSMEETIKQLRKNAPWAKICVGGAVLTQEYSDMIGADFYGKDAMATVNYALTLFK